MRSLGWIVLPAAALVGACSLANSPDDPVPLGAVTTSTVGSGGSGGATASSSVSSSSGNGGSGGGATTPMCGDNKTEGSEDCDEGAVETADCDPDCTLPECGDNYRNVLAGEECDDGNQSDGDACDMSCDVAPFVVDAIASQNLDFTVRPSATVVQLNGEDHFQLLWTQQMGGGATVRVVKTVYTAKGAPVGTPATVVSPGGTAEGSSTATNGLGRSMAVWKVGTNVNYRVVEPDGTLKGAGPDPISGSDPVSGAPPVVAASPVNDKFCVVWRKAADNNVMLRCFDEDGVIQGSDAIVGASSVANPMGTYGAHTVFADKDGFVVVWFDMGTLNMMGRQYSTVGAPLTDATILSSTATPVFVATGIGAITNDKFIVGAGYDGNFGEVLSLPRAVSLAFTNISTPNGGALTLSKTHEQERPAWMVPVGNNFIGLWSRKVEAFPECSIQRRLFTQDNVPLETSATTVSDQVNGECHTFPTGAVNAAGDAFFAWAVHDVAGTSVSIRAKLTPGLIE